MNSRIPATLQNSKVLASKLLLQKVETKAISVCPITGIILSMEIPAIEGFFFEQKNPIAETKNLFKLAELQDEILRGFEKPLLAGILLGIYKSVDLIEETETSAAEENLLLQSVHPSFLIESIKYFSSTAILKKIAECRRIRTSNYGIEQDFYRNSIPQIRISLKDNRELQTSSIQSVIKAFRKDVHEILFPVTVDRILSGIYDQAEGIHKAIEKQNKKESKAILMARNTKEREQKELTKEAKQLLSNLFTMGIINVALNNFVKLLLAKDALKDADTVTKQRAATALQKKNTTDSNRLAAILLSSVFSSLEDSLFEPVDERITEAMEEIVEEKKEEKKLSFAEMMAAKKAKQLEQEQALREEVAEELSETVEETDPEYPSDEEEQELSEELELEEGEE